MSIDQRSTRENDSPRSPHHEEETEDLVKSLLEKDLQEFLDLVDGEEDDLNYLQPKNIEQETEELRKHFEKEIKHYKQLKMPMLGGGMNSSQLQNQMGNPGS